MISIKNLYGIYWASSNDCGNVTMVAAMVVTVAKVVVTDVPMTVVTTVVATMVTIFCNHDFPWLRNFF